MVVKDLLAQKKSEVLTVEPGTDVRTAMQMLIGNRISCLPVLDSSQDLIGIVSDKDIFQAIYKNESVIERGRMSELMTRNLIVGLVDDEVNYIAGLMTKNKIRHIPIVEAKKLVGLISIGDVVKAQMSGIEIENRYLKNYIDGNYPG